MPNISILLMANVIKSAEKYLGTIRRHFLYNDKFQTLYSEHVPKRHADEGSSGAFTTPARTKKWIREASIEAAGIDKALVSRHYDYGHYDDIVDNLNADTHDKREKLWLSYTTSLSLVDGMARNAVVPWHTVVGTRWHMDDSYNRMLEMHKKKKIFDVYITSAYWHEVNEDGQEALKYLFPEEFGPERLEHLRNSQSAARFSCLYLNDPVPGGEAALDPANIQYISQSELPSPLNQVIAVDPANSEQTRQGDPTCISLFGMDYQRNIYTIEIRLGKWNLDEIVEHIIQMAKHHGVRTILVEAVSFQKWLCFALEKVQRDSGMYLDIVEIRRDTSMSKPVRQERCIAPVKYQQFFMFKNETHGDHVRREFREYPKGKHDHFLDTLTDAIERLEPPANPKAKDDDFRLPPHLSSRRRNFQTGYSFRSRHFPGEETA
jgi:predicted phage terminase large subunit-like protein